MAKSVNSFASFNFSKQQQQQKYYHQQQQQQQKLLEKPIICSQT
jgi:hypothetical protein